MPRIQFKGKNLVANHHLAAAFCEIKPRKDLSLLPKGDNVSLHDNLILHGDNLLALKSLLPTHAGKINCVYIDPPYNTGNEKWCYNDNVANPMTKEWLGKVVDREDLTRHDKWLCMMTPRLSLLHELLAEDGVIFIRNSAFQKRQNKNNIRPRPLCGRGHITSTNNKTLPNPLGDL